MQKEPSIPTADTAELGAKTGLLLINLGTPDKAETAAVRRYLAEFLSDRRVIELHPLLWQPLLHGIVLRSRPAKTAANYRKIWDDVADESPLGLIVRQQAERLSAMLGAAVVVRHAMRYGAPAIAPALTELRQEGCERILLAPLYPQYCSATTGTALEQALRHLAKERRMPAIRTLPPYHDDPAYIAALKDSLDRHLATLDFAPQRIIVSFHGMPERTRRLGDPYHDHCMATVRLLRQACGLGEDDMPVAFQSRFGRAAWLRPYLLPLVRDLARAGTRRVAVITPGFSADCLETLEEVAMQVRDAFLAAGGEHYSVVPCLNGSAAGMAMLETVLRRQLSGWVT